MFRLFPTGLLQPEGSLRFGADALLLAAFSHHVVVAQARGARTSDFRAAELGAGCGAGLIAFALLTPSACCLGLDCEAELVAAAIKNARLMGLDERIDFAMADFEQDQPPASGDFQLVMANPPWLRPGAGRMPRERLRRQAICLRPDTLSAFCRAASRLLRRHGFFCMIVSAELLCDICLCIASLPLGLRQILPLSSHTGKPASRLLLMAQKNAASEPRLLAPLYLHQPGQRWTMAALEFCPWLANSGIAS